eukprot:c1289_g1_i1.p1 GENE.c1289_g1_i1~~c1289_g1_i1.p1  ORF type:complete len:163 (+),score=34.55 c1289_g1_i1:50-490(+)
MTDKDVARIADELKQQGYKVEVIEEETTKLGKFVGLLRHKSIFAFNHSKDLVDKTQKTAQSQTEETKLQALHTVDHLHETAQQYPEAIIAGTATTVILASLYSRSLFKTTRNVVLGGIFVGAVLYPKQFAEVVRSLIADVASRMRQ